MRVKGERVSDDADQRREKTGSEENMDEIIKKCVADVNQTTFYDQG